MSEITASEQIRPDIIKKVNYDTAAAKLAIDWVGDSYLKSELSQTLSIVFTRKARLSRRPARPSRKRPKRWRCLIPVQSRRAKHYSRHSLSACDNAIVVLSMEGLMNIAEKISLWSMIGTWFSGIATVAAVLMAFHLANKRPKAIVKCTVSRSVFLSKMILGLLQRKEFKLRL